MTLQNSTEWIRQGSARLCGAGFENTAPQLQSEIRKLPQTIPQHILYQTFCRATDQCKHPNAWSAEKRTGNWIISTWNIESLLWGVWWFLNICFCDKVEVSLFFFYFFFFFLFEGNKLLSKFTNKGTIANHLTCLPKSQICVAIVPEY